MDMFMSDLRRAALSNENVAFSENGAKMYGTTGKALLDLNFSVSNLRAATDDQVVEKFMAAYQEDKTYALKWLFYARDVRQGLGERRLFRTVFSYLARTNWQDYRHLLSLIPFYGRWDDLIALMGTPMEADVLRLINRQVHADLLALKEGQPCSLLAKWMPGISCTSQERRALAIKIQKYMGMSIPSYRRTLAKLRRYIDVVEIKMSNGEWDQIDYSRVPGRANLLYANAFLRHDPERREAFLQSAIKGEVKMNAATLFPHEIIQKIREKEGLYETEEEIMAVRALWQNLPVLAPTSKKTIVVMDGSGSMKRYANEKVSKVQSLDIAIGLAIYFSQFLPHPYNERVITFSENPRFVDLSMCETIQSKVSMLEMYTEVANTNIERVFELVLQTALDNELKQEDLPDNILIISDMEFDRCACTSGHGVGGLEPSLFENIATRYVENGYVLPRVCFWNTRGRSGAIPMIQNDMGFALMSGYSVNNAKLIMSGVLDPYEGLLEVLNSERYAPVVPVEVS